jgi:TetR/AcrR family transcriptional regulator, cholesterol catabolism regulator
MGITQRAEQAVEPGRRPAGMTRSPRGTRGPAREERIERRRREVREAATRIMIATGYHGMSMQAVADEAQMSVGLIYSYFGGKEELLQSVIVDILDEFRVRVPESMASAGSDPVDRLRQGFQTFCTIIDEKREGALLAYRESQTLPKSGQREIIRLELETTEPFQQAVEDGIASGVFRPVDAELVTHNLKMAAHSWALKHWHLAPRMTLQEYIDRQLELALLAMFATPLFG